MTSTITNSNKDLFNLLNFGVQQNMSDKIYQRINELIIDNILPEGYIFPNETTLCEQLGVGRSTIREAYKALEITGCVTRTKRGTVVNNISQILSSTPLKLIAQKSSRNDFLEFRLMVEEKTAALAATNATEEELVQLETVFQQFVTAQNNSEHDSLRSLDQQFHNQIASATHNSLIISTMYAISEYWEIERSHNFFNTISNKPDALVLIVSQHKSILDAISKHDSILASTLMHEHIMSVSQY